MGSPIIFSGSAAKLLKSQLTIPGSTSGSVSISAGTTPTAHTVTWPSANASGSLTNDGSGNLSWASATAIIPVATKTANYTLTGSDGLILADATSAGFNLTLPTAVGNTGLQLRMKKTDVSLNALTILTTSSQTIDGVTSTSLASQYEEIMVVSDGANWQLQHRHFSRALISFTPTGTFLSNCTYTGYYWREGRFMNIDMAIAFTGATTSTTLTVNTPTGFTLDTTGLVRTGNNQEAVGFGQGVLAGSNHTLQVNYNGSNTFVVLIQTNTAGGQSNLTNSNGGVIQNADSIQLNFRIPITGWNG